MKNIKIILLLMLVSMIFIAGCSSVSTLERQKYCIDNGMQYTAEYSGGWRCSIDDERYNQQINNQKIKDYIDEKLNEE